MTTYVTSTFTVPGFHEWHGAPPPRGYLAFPHRHLFHVSISVHVNHDDRDVEFHDLADWGKQVLHSNYEFRSWAFHFGGQSCEAIARRLMDAAEVFGYPVKSVTVSEDGEFSATVEAE